MPGCWLSRLSTSAPSVLPLPSTVLLPPVWVRRMVGIRTSMAMACGSPRYSRVMSGAAAQAALSCVFRANARSAPGIPGCGGPPSSVVDDGGRRVPEQVGLDDLHLLLGHLAVDDAEAAELHVVVREAGPVAVLPRGDQHVVGVRF